MTIELQPDSDHLAQQLCRAAEEIGVRGWCDGTGGNFSVVLTRDPFRLLISGSGTIKYRLFPDDLVLVDEQGQAVENEIGQPSDESLLHCTIACSTDAGSILHTHSVSGTLLSEHFQQAGGFDVTGYEMIKGISGVESHEERVFVPVVPNSQDMNQLSRVLESVCNDRPATKGVLVAGHGLYTWGRDVEEAQRHVEIFEFLFECVERRTRLQPFEG